MMYSRKRDLNNFFLHKIADDKVNFDDYPQIIVTSSSALSAANIPIYELIKCLPAVQWFITMRFFQIKWEKNSLAALSINKR